MSEGKLPEGWVESQLSEICTKPQYGYTTKSSASGEIKYLRTTDITKGAVSWSDVPYCLDAPDDVSKYQLHDRDIVISRAGSIGFSSLLKNPPHNAVFASYLIRFKPSDFFSDLYLKRFLESGNYWDQLSSMSAGNAVQNVNAQKLSTLIVPIPPLTEQKVIAEKLDTLLAQVDSTKARLEQIPKILKRFRQAVLASAVRGKLTDDWLSSSNLVDTESLLKEIEIERDKAKDNRLIKPSFGKKKNISPLFEIPSDSWGWVGFEQICATNNNALKAGPFGSALKKADCVEDGYKVYGQEQVISGSESLETYRINDEKYDQLKSCTVGPGDILVSLVGTIGKVMVLSSQAEIGIINPRLVKITLHEKVNPKYIKIYLDSPISHGFFKGFSHGGTMDILNLGILKELPITLPPKEEQAEIVRRVEQLFAYADTIEKQVNNALARVNNLTQSILAKAFRGELTAQWRTENPELISGENSAAALLEKIKAERAASTGKKASRKKS
ncbi:restriction endonuclease subunit S [Pantoea agglomerans]|uniref:restriction endonuclease subunit S n=1 Tax=Enterobacter agglomerans TaxID=549 RepID=UPI00026D2412|nr:restriction endonuclease subunit S [Pantoea agglomerans]